MSDETNAVENVYHYQSDNMPKEPPSRVVSAVPSITETLFTLGFGAQVVGITDDCLFPADALNGKYRIGPLDQLKIQGVIDLRPDVVIVNREENTTADIAALEAAGLHVWKTFPRTVLDAMNIIWDVVHMFMVDDRMLYERVNLINRTIDWVGGVAAANEDNICKVFVPLLREPLATFTDDTYAGSLLTTCGGNNVFGAQPGNTTSPDPAEDTGRYPVITWDAVQAAAPDVIVLPGHPLPFTEADVAHVTAHLDVPATRNGHVYLIDGSLLTYHGTRLARALNEISALMCDVEDNQL